MGTREEAQASNSNNKNGTVPPDPYRHPKKAHLGNPASEKLRKYHSIQDMSESTYEHPLPRNREVSISDKFKALSLNEKSVPKKGIQVTSSSELPPPTSIPQPVSPCKRVNSRGKRQESPTKDVRDPAVPTTPDKGKQLLDKLENTMDAIRKTPIVAMSPSPRKGPFLSKYSNLTGYVVAEIEEKISKMDSEFQTLKEFMSTTEKNNISVKEELEMAKKRGR